MAAKRLGPSIKRDVFSVLWSIEKPVLEMKQSLECGDYLKANVWKVDREATRVKKRRMEGFVIMRITAGILGNVAQAKSPTRKCS